jgi:hypothetical protein
VHWGVCDGLLGFLKVVVGKLWLWLLGHHLSV